MYKFDRTYQKKLNLTNGNVFSFYKQSVACVNLSQGTSAHDLPLSSRPIGFLKRGIGWYRYHLSGSDGAPS